MAAPLSWLELGGEITRGELKGSSTQNARARRSVNEFCDWAEKNAVGFPADLSNDATVVELFTQALEHHRNDKGVLNRNGESAVEWAKELLKRSRRVNEEPTPPPAEEPMASKRAAKHEEEERNEEEEFEEDDEEGGEDDEEFEEDDEEEPEPEPAPRKKRAGRQQVIQVAIPPPRARGARAEPRSKKLFDRPQEVKLFKMDDYGKRVEIGVYTAEDIAGRSLKDWIEDVIHPRFYNENSDTEYLVYEMSADGKLRPQPFKYNVEMDDQPQENARDPLNTVRSAFSLFNELRGPQQEQEKNPALVGLAQQKAASGDLSGVMMAMMMEKLFSQQSKPNDDALFKILEYIKGQQAPAQMGPPPGWGPGPGWGPPPAPAASSSLDKVVELAVSKLVSGPPTFAQQMAEFAQMQQFLKPQDTETVTLLRQEIAALKQAIANGNRGPTGGLDESVASFEKITTLVKTLAPQVGGNEGFAGFLRGVLTPQVGQALRDAVTGAPPQQPQAPGQPAQQQAPQQQQRDPRKPPNPVPPAVMDAVKAIHIAQTAPARAERFAEFVIAMATSNDPYYNALLAPSFTAMQQPVIGVNELTPVRKLAMQLIWEQKREWATPEFADACIAALATKAGAQMPDALVQTRGAWMLDFKGDVVMLSQMGAVPVQPGVPPQQLPGGEQPQPVSAGKPVTVVPDPIGAPGTEFPKAEPLSAPPKERKKRPTELDDDDDDAPVKPTKQAKAERAEQEQANGANGAQVEPVIPSVAVIDAPPAQV